MVESLDSPRPQPTPIQPLLTGQSQSGGQYVAVLNDENKVINISAMNSLDIDLSLIEIEDELKISIKDLFKINNEWYNNY